MLGFLMTTTIAIFFWAFNPQRPASRWAGLVFFTAGAGFIGMAINHSTISYLDRFQIEPDGYSLLLRVISDLSTYISVFIFPVCYLMFGLHHCERWRPGAIIRLLPVFLLPALLPIFFPSLKHPVFILSWVTVYILASSALIIWSFAVEKNPDKKIFRAVSAIFFVPLTTIDLITGYVSEVIHHPFLRLMNIALAMFAFLLFVFFLIRHGLLGIRLRMERQQFDLSMEGLSAGTLKLSHALRNQLSKIRIYALIIRRIAIDTGRSDLNDQADLTMNTADHMIEMMKRIELQSQAMMVDESEICVRTLIDTVIRSFALESRGIAVEEEYPYEEAVLMCDKAHLQEMLTNLISNALDAIAVIAQAKGKLTIGYAASAKWFTIYVKDNGCGIPKDRLRKVLQPFYTTKMRESHHLGMGLSYCYSVMSKHGGDLQVISEEGKGTEVRLLYKMGRLVLSDAVQGGNRVVIDH